MMLSELAEIVQGNIPTRIESEIGEDIAILTMQELNYIANITDEEVMPKYLKVQSNKVKTLAFVREGDVVLNLSSCKAIVVDGEIANKLILSNLAIIRICNKNILDPNYLCWYINKNLTAIKKFKQLQQGTRAVSIVPLNTIKNFEIDLISIEKQIWLGRLYELQRKRYRINKIIEQKQSEVLLHKLMNIFEKEMKNGKK